MARLRDPLCLERPPVAPRGSGDGFGAFCAVLTPVRILFRGSLGLFVAVYNHQSSFLTLLFFLPINPT